MSSSREVEFFCPHCKARNRATMWLQVNAASDPALARRVVDGSLFEQTCWHCRQTTALDHTLRYQDPQRRLWLLNAPPDDPLAGELESAQAPPEGYRLRRVEDMNALKELLHIWDDDLDDATMLLLKHMLAARVLRDTGSAPALCSYDTQITRDRQEWLEYIVFQTEESEPETLTVPMIVYADLLKTIEPHKEELFPIGEWVHWDHTTAGRMWEALQETERPTPKSR